MLKTLSGVVPVLWQIPPLSVDRTMELLLNLFWMLLALPAYLVWRNQSSGQRSFARLHNRSGMLLGCVLLLLFPVVSATDDMHALRTELEESSFSKQIKNADDHKSSPWLGNSDAPSAQPGSFAAFRPSDVICGRVVSPAIAWATTARFGDRFGRAPPLSLLPA